MIWILWGQSPFGQGAVQWLRGTVFAHIDPAGLIRLLQIATGKRIIPGRTLLILDEIQECPRALTALKFFNEDMPELAVMAAGAPLGLSYGKSDDDDADCWLRIRRDGNAITCSYRKVNGGGWKNVYRFDVSPDVYGETVYVGLTSTSYIGVEYSRTPTYDWHFSNIVLRGPKGSVISVR